MNETRYNRICCQREDDFSKRNLKKYEIPFYEKDNIVWERTCEGDKKRSSEERNRIFREIIERKRCVLKKHFDKSLFKGGRIVNDSRRSF